MWKLIGADIEYNRILYIFVYGLFFIPVLANSILGGMEGLLALLMLGLVWITAIVSGADIKTKKIRFMAALPLSAKRLAMYRNVIFIFQWLEG